MNEIVKSQPFSFCSLLCAEALHNLKSFRLKHESGHGQPIKRQSLLLLNVHGRNGPFEKLNSIIELSIELYYYFKMLVAAMGERFHSDHETVKVTL